ncbi:sensor histidine kinase [Corallococcus macrosporus]|uniref:histidine kinase n=1 Tax=Corallococcus macrosporus DSM 14697 TaxID=1189310 RepID=A0A286NW80_9BACT|nr:PAS domain-containing sensor histidine kinase [Corallococcus macrosporus]ATB51425.1 PAS domain-containing sensor histidine kinase [Corallococcus macrosporus DSM 14697]
MGGAETAGDTSDQELFNGTDVSLWVEDFTAVTKALDALRSSGVEDLRAWLAAHPGFVLEAAGWVKVLDVNDATVRLLEARDRSEVLGTLPRFFAPETAKAFAAELLLLWEGGTRLELETVLQTLGGRRIDVTLTLTRPAKERSDRVFITMRDVTASKASQRALQESEARFRNMADHAPVMLWVTDATGRCVYLSRTWYEFTGQTEAEGLGFGWLQAVHPDDAEPSGAVFLAANARRSAFRLDYRLRRRDGEYLWAIDSASPRFGPGGEFLGYIGSVIDISERKQVEQERERLLAAMDEAIRLRDEFLAVASHELKTPLTPLNLKLQTLARAVQERRGPELLERLPADLEVMQRQVKRLSALVGELLDVTLISGGQLRLELEPVDLGALVREVAARFDGESQRTATPLQAELDEEVVGLWDRVRLEQAVSNLLSNALKYGVGRPIHLQAGKEAEHAWLTIRDEGIGIPPEALDRIFEKFERAVSERHYGGLGLGLYVTRQNVRAMGGSIDVRSTLGQGATFTVRLPCRVPGVNALREQAS